jgi:hypothetical protein
MSVTRALALYIDSVDKHIAEYNNHPVTRAGCELKFVKYCAYRDQDPAEVANCLSRVRLGKDADMPPHLLWMSGAWDFICYTQ